MKLLIELDLSAIVAEEPDDIGAAEGLAAAMLRRAAGKIVKDGFPAVDGLAFALMHDGKRMGRMIQVDDKASPLLAEAIRRALRDVPS